MSETWKCPKCGTENAADDNFCGECGTKKPVIGIGMAQTIEKPEKVETSYTSVDDLELEESKKKGVGKIVLILLVICVLAAACIMVIDAQEKVRIAEQQRIEKEREEAERRENIRRHQCESADRLFPCKDNSTGLFWSSRAPKTMKWGEAKKYCENLNEGGYSDWRLPNIDELRTTIRNCSKIETDGECKVSEKSGCLSWELCRTKDSCDCIKSKGVKYSKLGDDEVWLISSSPNTTFHREDRPCLWGVSFHAHHGYENEVFIDYICRFYSDISVRCVRDI